MPEDPSIQGLTAHARFIRAGSKEHKVVGDTVKDVTIASNQVVPRPYGEERLVINRESVVAANEVIPLLKAHSDLDPSADHNRPALGEIGNMRILDNRIIADVSFDRSTPEGQNAFKSVVDEGRSNALSIVYYPERWTTNRMGMSRSQSRVVDRFRLSNVSVVGRGADSSAGFFRSDSPGGPVVMPLEATGHDLKEADSIDATNQAEPMPDDQKKNNTPEVNNEPAEQTQGTPEARAATEEKVQAPVKVAPPEPESRAADPVWVMGQAEKHGLDNGSVKGFIQAGYTEAQVNKAILDGLEKRSAAPVPVRFADNRAPNDGVLRDGKTEYSFRGAISALVTAEQGSGDYSAEASLARDVSKELGGGMGKSLRLDSSAFESRAYTAGGTTTGTQVIEDTVRMDKFVEFLHANTVTQNLGIDVMNGLTNNILIPSDTDTTTMQWYGETAQADFTDITQDQIELSPKRGVVMTKFSDLASAQIPSVQARLQRHLQQSMATAIDRTTLFGAASGRTQPIGLYNSLGADQTTDSGNPSASGNNANYISIDQIFDALEKIETANITQAVSLVSTPKVVTYLRKLRDKDGQYLWTQNHDATTVMMRPGAVGGIPVYVSTNFPTVGRTVRTPSSNNISGTPGNDVGVVLLGAWSNLTQAYWRDSFTLEIDREGSDFRTGQRSLRLQTFMDVAVTRPAAFGRIVNILRGQPQGQI